MINHQHPHDRFHQSIVEALESSGFTIAELGRNLSEKNGKDPRTCEQQIRRLEKRLSVPVIELISVLDAFGYDVIIKKR